jgi:hypothetical protein
MEKWTRGEDVRMKFLVFEKEGDWWIETVNHGGGACSTRWHSHLQPSRAVWQGQERD